MWYFRPVKMRKVLLLAISMLLAPILRAQQPDLIICKGGCINYFNIITSGTAVSWLWTFQGANPATSNQKDPTNICYPDTGLFQTTITTTFSDGTDTTQSLWVKVLYDKILPPNLGNDTSFCGSISRLLDAGNPGSRYTWNTGNPTDTFQTLQINSPGTYQVRIYNQCDDQTFQVVFTQIPDPVVDLGPDRTFCNETGTSLDAGNPGCTYLWTPNGETSRTITTNIQGTYGVTVTNPAGCSVTDQVFLKDSCPPTIFIPTSFTPNDDQLNDYFSPAFTGMVSMKWSLFDRWGEKIFETDKLDGKWDGNWLNKPCAIGVYSYFLEYLTNSGVKGNLKGTVTLLR